MRDCKLAAAVRAGLWDDSIMWDMLRGIERVGRRVDSEEWTCVTYEHYGLHLLCPHHAEDARTVRTQRRHARRN